MSPLQHAAPVVPGDKPYDPEIKDMADYIHNYNVNSDLAVRWFSRIIFVGLILCAMD